MYPEIEERVDTLENLLGQFIVHTNLILSRLERDTREFKNEMREFKNEMREFKNEVRQEQKALNLEGEFDVIAVSDANQVFVVEVKSTPNKEYINEFLENIEKFKQLFPEYSDKLLIPIFAGLRFEEDIVALATQRNVYVMAYREWEYLDILNFEDVQQKEP